MASATVGSSFQLQIWGGFTGQGLGAGGNDFLWDTALVQLANVALEFGIEPSSLYPARAALLVLQIAWEWQRLYQGPFTELPSPD